MSEESYYLSWSQKESTFSFWSRQMNRMVNFRYCTILTEITGSILKGYNECIEIINLHSTGKGQGAKMLSELIELSCNYSIPLALYAETAGLVEYYRKQGFVNYGNHGVNNEFLMLRIPS